MKHIHTYGCLVKLDDGTMQFACGFPIGPEAKALLQAMNKGNQEEFDRLATELEQRWCR
jgi:hypothetical protein